MSKELEEKKAEEKNAERIKDYYKAQGMDVNVWVEFVKFGKTGSGWCVRSNIGKK